ncbi:MAG: 2TM domain-containing protein, partial [Bacillota bacterium]|nr:2TM domain-containing protein [Bacillota bacterium]
DEELYRLARKRVGIKRNFLIHFGIFAVVNVALGLMNLLVSPGYLWFLWCVFGWGIGVGAHWISAAAQLNLDYKDTAVKKEMEYIKEKRAENKPREY